MTAAGNDICRIFAADTLAEAAQLLESEREVFVVYDEAVAFFTETVLSAAGKKVRGTVALEAGEEAKEMDTVLLLCCSMLEEGLDRGALVVTVGGGSISDTSGFAASLYKRGVRYANIPTTLLAQVDAGIGGKTGVNFQGYKNMLGVIRQPEWTLLCPEVLQTLPPREFFAGAAEMLKAFLIGDGPHYTPAIRLMQTLKADFPDGIGTNGRQLQELILSAASVKAGIVVRDPYEAGERRKLNLGHTFAHAIESCAFRRGEDIPHGEAVAMGIVLAAALSDRLGVSDGSMAERLTADFDAAGLRRHCPYPAAELADAMRRDKKADDEGIHFILPRRIGEVVDMKLTVEQALDL